MLDIFVGFFTDPLSIVMMGIAVGMGVLVGLFLRPWVGNQVIKISPHNHTFLDLGIEEETSISIECEKTKGMPPQRFFKLHPGFTGIVGKFLKKPITRYFGMEGTAYTWRIDQGSWHKLGTLAAAVRSVWGEDFYRTVPDNQKDLLEKSKINVTVGLEKAPLTPAGMRSISEEDIKQEEDRKASQTFWEEHAGAVKGWIVNMILAGGTGFGIALALQILGILDISPMVQPVNPAPAVNQTVTAAANMLRSMLGS